MVRSTLLRLSENKKFGSWVISNGTTRRMARRFVAGETLEEAVAAARSCNDAGMTASLDYLGENVASTSDAQRSRDEYLAIFETIAQENLQANVSCKLTQLGLDINCEFCTGLVLSIVERAASFDNFLRIDMEGSAYTQNFEFQILYAVRTDLHRLLVKDVYRIRIYIPYSNDWFPYFMRRLAERPANVGFILRNLFRR